MGVPDAPADLLGDGRLLKQVLRAGHGKRPAPGDCVSVHYECRLAGCDELIDSSRERGQPLTFTLGQDEVIPGWERGVAAMDCGELAALTVHPDLAYGDAGCAGDMVPPLPAEADGKATPAGSLHCDIELLEVGETAAQGGPEAEFSAEERLERAMRAREAGNGRFKAGELADAAASYESALRLLGHKCTWADGTDPEDDAREQDARWADDARREVRDSLSLACLLNLAQCELRLERLQEAMAHASAALDLDPASSKALYRRGLAAMRSGLLVQARADLERTARLEPKSAEVRAQLQACQKRLQESEQRDRSTFGGLFGRGSLYAEKASANLPSHDLARLPRAFLVFGEAPGQESSGPGLPRGGRIDFVLYADTVPKAAEGFRALCAGEAPRGYRGSQLHRVARGFAVQGGDIEFGDGTGGASALGGPLTDEDLGGRHDRKGVLSLANSGPDSSGAQFFVTFAAAPQLDGKHVVVGEVVEGWDVLDALEAVDVDERERPLRPLVVLDCGAPPAAAAAAS